MKSRDQEYLNKLRDYYARYRVLPSFSGIADLVGLKSTSAVSSMVNRLKAVEMLASAPNRRLQPGKRFFQREVADTVRAGRPQPANDLVAQGIGIDAHLIDSPSRTVLLTVEGDSMANAGLLPGDTIVVKKNAPTTVGDIVVAIVGNDYTVKYLAKDKAGFYLKPGNNAYPNIRPKDGFELFGLVVGSFRKYA